MSERVLVTSALPYANGPIHFGHIVGAYLPADVYVRFRRMLGDDVHYVCGTDEHGVAITLKAEQAGQSYESYVDHWHAVIRDSLARLGIEFDCFTGTAHHRNPYHRELAQQFFLDLQANGYLAERTEEQFYSERSQRFLPDRYVEGTCYHCGHEKARGDECPSCGRFLDARRLKDPRSTIDGSVPVLKATTHWYLDLARARDEWLRAWFESKGADWKPNVRNFVLGDLDELRERAITRDLPWGVPVPAPGSDGKVLYVWFDAPIGYLSISRQYWEARGEPARFEEFWKSADTKLFHFIGKDNITFHAVVFPAMLRGTGAGWILPENVPANEFFNLEGRKFNTSSGWFVPAESVADDPTDALRYALCTMMPETADSEWTWEEYRSRVNDDLADNLGNFATRTLRFVERFFDAAIPALGELTPADRELFDTAEAARDELVGHLHAFRFRQACRALTALGNACNRYYDQAEPWLKVKDDAQRPRAAQVMRVCAEMIGSIAVLSAPVMPATSATLLRALGHVGAPPRFDAIGAAAAQTGRLLPVGAVVGAPLTAAFPKFTDDQGREKSALFLKIAEERVKKELERLRTRADHPVATAPATSAAPAAAIEPLAPGIEFDAFAAVDMRAGTIVAADRHPRADRLLVLSVDLGFETRTICAGVAAAYTPDELIGRRVIAVANLAARKLRGIESCGMLLATDDAEGKPRFLAPDPATPNGARVS
ncbi:MAG: methionine--tRNA ligase [Planctomycetes bacterium]|nr:methionine--tRNA ligase [Planctomycetota bacterium]